MIHILICGMIALKREQAALMKALEKAIAAIDVPLKERIVAAPADGHLESLVNKVQFAVGTKPASNENILEGLNVLHTLYYHHQHFCNY